MAKDNTYQEFLEKRHSALNTSDEILGNIVTKVNSSGLRTKNRIIAGEVNEVYEVVPNEGKSLIVRISRAEHVRFPAEKWAIEKCKEVGVPVPNVLLLDTVETGSEKLEICVEEKLEGVPLEELLKKESLSQSEIKDITVQAGQVLSKIHSINIEGFGGIDASGVGKHRTWLDYMLKQNQKLSIVLEKAQDIGVELDLIEKAFGVLERYKSSYGDTKSRLAHADYGVKHMLIKNKKINGIIDFEYARGTDISYDFAWWNYFGENWTSVDWLIEGYEKNGDLGENFETRMHLVKIRIALGLIPIFEEAGHGFAKEITTKNLAEDIAFFQ